MQQNFRRTPALVTAPKTVVGYHGCSREIAEAILAGEDFRLSSNAYDWLGAGAYFWEYAPYRALEWAKQQFGSNGSEPAVLGATIRLGRCLNLLDIEHIPDLLRAYRIVEQNFGNRRMPINTETGAHFLDREVLDAYCHLAKAENDYLYQTVRGSYPEGEPVFAGSKILTHTHVQIAVRDISCLSRLHMVKFS